MEDENYTNISTMQELALLREEIVKQFNYINNEVKQCIKELDKTKSNIKNLNDIECIDCCTQLDATRDKMNGIVSVINSLLN